MRATKRSQNVSISAHVNIGQSSVSPCAAEVAAALPRATGFQSAASTAATKLTFQFCKTKQNSPLASARATQMSASEEVTFFSRRPFFHSPHSLPRLAASNWTWRARSPPSWRANKEIPIGPAQVLLFYYFIIDSANISWRLSELAQRRCKGPAASAWPAALLLSHSSLSSLLHSAWSRAGGGRRGGVAAARHAHLLPAREATPASGACERRPKASRQPACGSVGEQVPLALRPRRHGGNRSDARTQWPGMKRMSGSNCLQLHFCPIIRCNR